MRLCASTAEVSHVDRAQRERIGRRTSLRGLRAVTRSQDRSVLLIVLVALSAAIAWSSTATGDYIAELRPAVEELLRGDIGAFLSQAPVYGPSVLPRVPFILFADWLGTGATGIYIAGAFACRLVLAFLAWHLDGRLAAIGRDRLTRAVVIAVILIAPWLLRAARMGHPEETMTGALCVLAILAALDGRTAWAGLALGLAVAFKPWALLAVGPVLCAATGDRWRLLLWALGAAVVLELPFLIARPGGVQATARATSETPFIFHPQQLFWFLHEHVRSPVSDAIGYRGPGFLRRWAHPLIIVVGAAVSAAFALRLRRRAVEPTDALALFALLILLRSLLDPWNTIYYAVPAILALATWEALVKRGLPWRAMLLMALGHLSFVVLPDALRKDWQSLVYLAWMLPAVTLLALETFGVRRREDRQTTISATEARRSSAAT